MFIAIEGIDAAGKQTQTQALVKKLGAPGWVESFSFPKYDNLSGQLTRDYLVDGWTVTGAVVNSRPETSAYVFQCCQLVNKLESLPASVWTNGPDDLFIADRYAASAYAYGAAAGLDLEWLVKVYARLPQPDVNIFLDITVEESFRRRPNRRDQYERNRPFLERVRQSYLDVFGQLGPRYVVVDAMVPEDVVTSRLLDVINAVK